MIDLGEQVANLVLPALARWFLDRSRAMLDPGEGPRTRLQSKEATKEQTFEMLQSLNYAMDDDGFQKTG